jgi:hypothetical protein
LIERRERKKPVQRKSLIAPLRPLRAEIIREEVGVYQHPRRFFLPYQTLLLTSLFFGASFDPFAGAGAPL